MTDYIRRKDALFALRKAERGGSMTALTRLERAYSEIREMPAADVAKVVHARWDRDGIKYTAGERVKDVRYCSKCACRIDAVLDDTLYLPKHCPECGAKMDGGEKDG